VVVTCLPSEFAVTSRRDGARTVVRFDGELDCANEGLARAEVEIAVDRGGTELVLDLRGLTFMDARGLHVLLDARSACTAQQRRLLLASVPDHVQRLLELCRVDGYFELLEPGDHPRLVA
jgi:anti-sigma B factor antagonist